MNEGPRNYGGNGHFIAQGTQESPQEVVVTIFDIFGKVMGQRYVIYLSTRS